jgi:hypothetical protein
MLCIEGEHPTQAMNWKRLPVHERERWWLTELRMYEQIVNKLLGMVSPKLEESRSRNINMRKYSNKAKLMITLSFLVHCSTLVQMDSKWGCPTGLQLCACKPPPRHCRRSL